MKVIYGKLTNTVGLLNFLSMMTLANKYVWNQTIESIVQCRPKLYKSKLVQKITPAKNKYIYSVIINLACIICNKKKRC